MTQTTTEPVARGWLESRKGCRHCRKPSTHFWGCCSDKCSAEYTKDRRYAFCSFSIISIILMFIFAIVKNVISNSELPYEATLAVGGLNSISIANIFFLMFFVLTTILIIWNAVTIEMQEHGKGRWTGSCTVYLIFITLGTALIGFISYILLFPVIIFI